MFKTDITIPNIDKILSKKDYEHHKKIFQASEDIKDANARYNQLITECDHKLIPLTPNQIKSLKDHEDLDSWDFDEANCMICGKFFGWRCPDSPDGACHYNTKEFEGSNGEGPFYVELINRKKHIMPEHYDYEKHIHESSDCCLFCGSPDERL